MDDNYEDIVEQERAHTFGSKYSGTTSSPLGVGGRHSYDIPQYMIRAAENEAAVRQGAERPHNIDVWGRRIKTAVHNSQLKLSDFAARYGARAKEVFGAVLGKIHRGQEAKAAPHPASAIIKPTSAPSDAQVIKREHKKQLATA